MLLTEKYSNIISAVLTCYDRIIIQGVIPNWSYGQGITAYFKANGIRIFDFADFTLPEYVKMLKRLPRRMALK